MRKDIDKLFICSEFMFIHNIEDPVYKLVVIALFESFLFLYGWVQHNGLEWVSCFAYNLAGTIHGWVKFSCDCQCCNARAFRDHHESPFLGLFRQSDTARFGPKSFDAAVLLRI